MKWSKCVVWTVLLGIAGAGSPAWAQWNYLGPDGAYVETLLRSPDEPATVYVGSWPGGAWRSLNGGATWSPVQELTMAISQIVADPQSPGRLLACTDLGVYESTDRGASWHHLALSESVQTGAIADGGTILAGTRHGIQVSHDGAQTWAAAEGVPDDPVMVVTLNPSDSLVAYAWTLGQGIFKTTDGGDHWVAASQGLPSTAFYTIVIDPQSTDHLWVGTWDQGVFQSLDGGGSWSAAGSELAGAYVPVLKLEAGSPARLWAGSSGGVWTSDDGGSSWQEHVVGSGDSVVSALALAAGSSPMLAGLQGPGVMASADGGTSWNASSSGLEGARVRSLAVLPGDPATLICGLSSFGLERSGDGGATWELRALTGWTVRALRRDPVQAGRVWAATFGGGLYRSDDAGLSWSWLAGSAGMGWAETLEVVGGSIVTGTDYGVERSTDGGASWTVDDLGASNPRVASMAAVGGSSQRLFVGLNAGGVYRSDDAGASWVQADQGLPPGAVWSLAADPGEETVAYAVAGDTFLYRTADSGASWAQVATQPPVSLEIATLAVAPDGTVYVGSGGVYRSLDGGATWSEVGTWTSTVKKVNRLVLVSTDPLVLYAATNGKGVWKYSEAGALWIPVVSHADGVGGSIWRSDVWILNPSQEEETATLVFHGASGERSEQYAAPAGTQVGLADVVQLMGGDGSGSLEVMADGKLLAASRTYNVSGAGTFGQSYPAVTAGSPTSAGEAVLLTQLVENDDFRTNIGLVNIGAETIDLGLQLFDSGGVKRAEYPVTLDPGEWRLELRPFWNAAGLDDLDGGWARVTAPQGGDFVALGSVLDNATGDPTSILMSTPAGQGSLPTWIPVVAHTGGLEGSVWRSDVAILNAGSAVGAIDVTLHQGQSPPVQQISLNAGEQRIISDVMSGFGASGSAALSLSCNQPLAVSSRTFNLSPTGTFGQSYPSQREDGVLRSGETGWLLGLAENDTYRSNIGLVNLSWTAATVQVELFRGDGSAVGSSTHTLSAGEWKLDVQPFADAGVTDLDQGFARVSVTSGGGVWALASVIDNRTNDPTTVIVVR